MNPYLMPDQFDPMYALQDPYSDPNRRDDPMYALQDPYSTPAHAPAPAPQIAEPPQPSRDEVLLQQLQQRAAQQQAPLAPAPQVTQLPAPLSPEQQESLAISQGPQLQAPEQYQPIYGDEQLLNPKRLMWAGLLSDLGNYIGSGGRQPMQGLAMKNFQQASQYNNRLTAANQAAKRQHWQDQNAYVKGNQQMAAQALGMDATKQQIESGELTLDQQRRAEKLGITPGAGQPYNNWVLAGKPGTYKQWLQQGDSSGLDRKLKELKIEAAERALIKAEDAGVPLDVIKQEEALRKSYTGQTSGAAEVLSKAQSVLSQLSLGSGAGDIAATIEFFKTLDPSSVVSTGEQDSLSQASGYIANIKRIGDKMMGKGGTLGPAGRKDLAESVNALVKLAEADYSTTRGEQRARLEALGGTVNADRILGTGADFGSWGEVYDAFRQTGGHTDVSNESASLQSNRPWLTKAQ